MNQFHGMLSHCSHYLYHSFIIVLFYIFLMNDLMECCAMKAFPLLSLTILYLTESIYIFYEPIIECSLTAHLICLHSFMIVAILYFLSEKKEWNSFSQYCEII
jgi:hypothetical protein